MLLRLFSSKTRVDLLTLFFTHPEKRFYVRQIARELGRDISGIKRELDNLEKAGLLGSEKVGNLRYYSVNRTSPLYGEMKGIIAKTVGAQASIKGALERIRGIRSAWIYGPNTEGVGAIDLMIIGQVDLGEVNQAIALLERRLGREINYLVFDESDFQRRRAEEDPFLTEVLRGRRTVLIGREDGL